MNRRVRDGLLLAGIFVAGVVTGGLNTIGVGQRLVEHRLRVDNLQSSLVDLLRSELGLTAEQVQRIEPRVAEACEQYRNLTLETVDRVTRLVAAANEQIARELTPDQAARLRALEAERQKMVRERLEQDYLKRDFLGE